MLNSYSTFAGWFAKDPKVLGRVGHVLLQLPFASSRSPRQIVIADDCLQQVKVPTNRIAQVVVKSTEKHFGSKFFPPRLETCSKLLLQVEHVYYFCLFLFCQAI